MWLTIETFRTVVASSPLVAIDLLVQNTQGEIFLGQRLNRPAQGYWFVPGGRIMKNETLDAAFNRLTNAELGQSFKRSQARLMNVYEHFYADSTFGAAEANPDTHYIVLAYQIALPAGEALQPPLTQHDRYRWWSTRDMQDSAEVHSNTRAYLDVLR